MCIGNCSFASLHDYGIEYIRENNEMKKERFAVAAQHVGSLFIRRCVFKERNALHVKIQLQKIVFRFVNSFYCFRNA